MKPEDIGFCRNCGHFYHVDNMYDEDMCLECAADRESLFESIAVWGIPE